MTYRKRLLLCLLCYSLALMGCFMAFQYHREREFKAAELDDQLQLINAYMLSEISSGVPPNKLHLHALHPFEDLRVSVIDSMGRVLYDTAPDSLTRANHSNRYEIRQARIHGSAYDMRRHSSTTGKTYFYSARRGEGGMIVRSAVPYSMTLVQLLEADYSFIWVMGVITLILMLAGVLMMRRLTQNIGRLKKFAADVEQGRNVSDTEPFPNDELGAISNHIVRQYARLQQMQQERDEQHRAAMHQQQENQRIKKQLTNNINHELKTPVAAIQLCVETLLAHPRLSEDQRRDLLRRCLADSRRLQSLLGDVSMITRMEDGAHNIKREAIDLGALVADVCDSLLPQAENRGMLIENQLPDTLTMQGNEQLLQSIFHNLIANAIAYSGGSRVQLRLISTTETMMQIAVTDDGAGVGPEHLPHLFERFYRVDTGRSRAAGGTGLGLAIVKNAVIFHGGEIIVELHPAGGLQFRFWLKR